MKTTTKYWIGLIILIAFAIVGGAMALFWKGVTYLALFTVLALIPSTIIWYVAQGRFTFTWILIIVMGIEFVVWLYFKFL